MEYLLQLGTHLAFGGSNTDPKARQLHRRRVQYLSFFRNRFVQLPHQLREFRQASSILCQIGMVVAVRQQEHFQGAEGLHAGLHLHEFLHIQHAADAGPLHRICYIVQTPKGKAPALIQDPESLRRLHMHTFYRFKIRRNRKGQQPFFTQIRSSLFSSQHFHFFKFQRFNGKTPGSPIIHKKSPLKKQVPDRNLLNVHSINLTSYSFSCPPTPRIFMEGTPPTIPFLSLNSPTFCIRSK